MRDLERKMRRMDPVVAETGGLFEAGRHRAFI